MSIHTICKSALSRILLALAFAFEHPFLFAILLDLTTEMGTIHKPELQGSLYLKIFHNLAQTIWCFTLLETVLYSPGYC